MEVEVTSEGLNHCHHSRQELPAGDCMQKLHKCPHCTETEIIEQLSPEEEEHSQHLRKRINKRMEVVRPEGFVHVISPESIEQ
jgi:hypothetical protein